MNTNGTATRVCALGVVAVLAAGEAVKVHALGRSPESYLPSSLGGVADVKGQSTCGPETLGAR